MTRQQFEKRFIKPVIIIPLVVSSAVLAFYITWNYIAPAFFNH